MKLLRSGRIRGIDGFAALLIVAAAGIYAVRTVQQPQPLQTRFGKPFPSRLAERLDELGFGRSVGDAGAPVQTYSHGTVDGIRYHADGPYLTSGPLMIPLGSVVEVLPGR